MCQNVDYVYDFGYSWYAAVLCAIFGLSYRIFLILILINL